MPPNGGQSVGKGSRKHLTFRAPSDSEMEEGGRDGFANLYLQHALDLWVNAWRKKRAHGDMIVVRYADDAVLGFQHGEDADRFLAELQERLWKFGLEPHSEKTRLIEFGSYAAERRAKHSHRWEESQDGVLHGVPQDHRQANGSEAERSSATVAAQAA